MTQGHSGKGGGMEPKKRTGGDRRLGVLADLVLMGTLSLALVAAAWLCVPQPLVEDPVQTELLYIQVKTGGRETALWKPRTMVERQTARAIVDHMATLHKRQTLRPAPETPEGRTRMYVHFRTEDAYQVVALGDGGNGQAGVSYSLDRKGLDLAAQVLQPQELEDYIWKQIHSDLPRSGGRASHKIVQNRRGF